MGRKVSVHSHMILTPNESSKSALRHPENIDKLVFAEISAESEDSLCELVHKHKTHRTCSGILPQFSRIPRAMGRVLNRFRNDFDRQLDLQTRITTSSTNGKVLNYLESLDRADSIGEK